jgi:HK97 gp10 family phage protein
MRIIGMNSLRRELADLAPDIRAACRRALEQSAEAVVFGTKAGVRVNSGNLRESVRARYHNNRLRAEVGWWDRDDLYAFYHEHGTKKFPPQPALGPALEAERNQIGGRIQAEVRKVLRS